MKKPKCPTCDHDLGKLTSASKGNRYYRECSNDGCEEEAWEFVDGPSGVCSVNFGRFTRESLEGKGREQD